MNVSFFRTRVAVLLTLFIAVAMLQGCGGPGYKVVPVSGKVTFGGRPAANINVSFQPKGGGAEGKTGPGSVGVTDAQGHFTLRTVDPVQDGAVVGLHVVRLARTLKRDSADDSVVAKQFLLPEKCRDGSITFTVPDEGTTEANIEL